VSHNFIATVWRDTGLAPHREGTFKLSRDPEFAEKVADVVGLYLEPPGGAVVLSIDEKTQVQALDRTQPVLPIAFAATEKRVRDQLIEVSEPGDGSLVETDTNSSMVTTWTVRPADAGRSTVTVHTTWCAAFTVNKGIKGIFARSEFILHTWKCGKAFVHYCNAVYFNREAFFGFITFFSGDNNGSVLGTATIKGRRCRAF